MNSSIFHRSVRIRRHHNSISNIFDNTGWCFNDTQQIETIFWDHFSNHWKNSDSMSFDFILETLPSLATLIKAQKTCLMRTITRGEIYRILLSLPKGNSPSLDGVNEEFYKFFFERSR